MNKLILQAIKFGAVGLVNTAIGLFAIYALMYFFDVSPIAANAFGYILGLIVSYLLNRMWTFRNDRSAPYSIAKFVVVAAVAYAINLAIVLCVIDVVGANPYVAQLAGIFFYTFIMFFGCRFFVFHSPAKTGNGASHL